MGKNSLIPKIEMSADHVSDNMALEGLHKQLAEENDLIWALKKLRSELHEAADAINDYLAASYPVDFAGPEWDKMIEEIGDVRVLSDRIGYYSLSGGSLINPVMFQQKLRKIALTKMRRAVSRYA